MTKNTVSAHDAYLARKQKFDQLMANINSLGLETIKPIGDAPNWAHVGSLDYVVSKLQEISDFLNLPQSNEVAA